MRKPRKVTIRPRKDRGNKPTVYWRERIGGKLKQRSVSLLLAGSPPSFSLPPLAYIRGYEQAGTPQFAAQSAS